MPVSVKIKPEAYFLLAILILTLPIPWIAAAMFAAYIHELCHIAAILLCKSSVYSITVSGTGAKIHTAPLSCYQECLCALTGPCGSLLLTGFAYWIPRIAFCGLVQGLFNLIPVYPLDGGRVFRCFRKRFRHGIGKIPCKEVEIRVQ